MVTCVVTAKLSRPLEDWKRDFEAHREIRERYGVRDRYAGRVVGGDVDADMLVIFEADSEASLRELMAAESAMIASAGHVLESTRLILAD
ncbi:DUF3764 family protein [Pseudohaliea rubra]|uniref:DUF3764 family protein n=1 Tax=Pseudohaliea rubra TaxID=475795 RepID=UPI0005563F7D|nr:DUF3764 family protein [Pseudohaliea rubra]